MVAILVWGAEMERRLTLQCYKLVNIDPDFIHTTHGARREESRLVVDEWKMYHKALGIQRVFVFVSNYTPPYVLDYLKTNRDFLTPLPFSGEGFYFRPFLRDLKEK